MNNNNHHNIENIQPIALEEIRVPLIYHRHPINLLWPGIFSALAIGTIVLMAVTLPLMGIMELPLYLPYIVLFAGILIFLVISYFFMNWAFWFFDVWIISKDRVVDLELVRLFLYRRSELDLRQVQDIRVEVSGLIANAFRLGNISIQSASKIETPVKLMSIYEPYKVAQKISVLVKAAVDEMGHLESSEQPPE